MSVDDRIAALEARLERLEDERSVHAVLTRYAFAVDSGDVEAAATLFAEDCRIDIDKMNYLDGREAARGIVDCDAHRAILPNCAHVMGPFVVAVDGARAVATGYATIFLRSEGRSQVIRQSFGRWELAKHHGEWTITRRVSRSVGREDAGEVLRGGLDPTAEPPPLGRATPDGGNRAPDWDR
jgi:ketosteroid isomerase-like protein